MPSTAYRVKLARLIKELSAEYGGPVFDPHITLFGDIQGDEKILVNRSSQLASQLTQFTLGIRPLGYTSEYYKSFFIGIEGSKLMDRARRDALVLFEHQSDIDFMPHLSLMYGNQTNQEKKSLKEKLQSEIATKLQVDSLQLMAAFGSPENWRLISSSQLAVN